MAGGAGGKNAIHHVNAEARILLDFVGVADTHDVARLVFGQQRHDFRDYFEGELARLADAEAADGVAVEVHFNETLGALAAKIAVHAALDDAEEGLGVGAVRSHPNGAWMGHPLFVRGPVMLSLMAPRDFVLMGAEVIERALRPGHREAEALFGAGAVGGILRALVETHNNICAESDLDVDGVLGGEEVRAAVQMRAELDAVVGNFAERTEGEDLKAAGVSEERARPTHEFMKAAHAANGFVAGAEIEMVGVAEDDFCAEGFERVLRDGFDGALRADGHEDWGLDGLMRQKKTAASATGGGLGEELEERGHVSILVDGCQLSVAVTNESPGLKPIH